MEVDNSSIYTIILAGGRGERLWPYSRPDRPKQVIPLVGDISLLEQTQDRLSSTTKNIWVLTSKDQESLIKAASSSAASRVIVEPCARNTAAAILLGCLEVQKEAQASDFAKASPDRSRKTTPGTVGGEAVVAFLPADHFIPNTKRFLASFKLALEHAARSQDICLMGLKPTRPATGYGYIEVELKGGGGAGQVTRFHEKPSQALAERYVAEGNKFWNLGIFVGKVSTFCTQFELYAPEIYDGVLQYFKSKNSSLYMSVPSISIDHAIAEKSSNISMIPCDFVWSDVGNLDTFLSLRDGSKDVIEINSKNNLIDAKDKLAVLIGVENLCIVEEGGVLLVSRRDQVDEVKSVVNILKSREKAIGK